ncbi:MAG: MerR family DNA-binding transcriptional regulator [Lawsonibacter sp.]|nr:MerR family DNA-binding transcriptional regulator [Lawsonibacter sp.]
MKPSYTRRVSTMKKENLLSIGALSKQTGVHIKSLRYYDSLGILRPCLR